MLEFTFDTQPLGNLAEFDSTRSCGDHGRKSFFGFPIATISELGSMAGNTWRRVWRRTLTEGLWTLLEAVTAV
jgi:hypothetical protein